MLKRILGNTLDNKTTGAQLKKTWGMTDIEEKKKRRSLARATPEGDSSKKKKSVAKLGKLARTPKQNVKKLNISDVSTSTSSSLKRRLDTDSSNHKSKKPKSSPSATQSSSAASLVSIKKPAPKTDVEFEKAVAAARGTPDGDIQLAGNDETNGKKDSQKDKTPEAKKPKKKVINKLASKTLKKLKGKATVGAKGLKSAKDEKQHELLQMKKKERKKQRKQQNKNYELINDSKKIWEELRRHNVKPERKEALCKQLHSLVRGKAMALIYTHDATRAIQCLIKYGNQEQRQAIFEEVKDSIVEMMKSPYAHFCVKKLIKYGTKPQKNFIIKSLYGNVRRLIRHKVASNVLELAYNDYANAQQRASLVEEFYGPSFALFKTNEIRRLDQIMNSEPAKRDSVLSNLKEALEPLADKAVVNHSIVHRLFLEYFTYASQSQRTEMIEGLRELLVPMIHTRDGARVAMYCLWYGTAKDRKVIIKSMKTHVARICKDEHGHMVLLALFDVVDDTKIVQKAVLEEMMKSLHEVALDVHGRKVLLYLLVHRDPLHFMPDVVKVLKMGDDNPTSKKEISVRRKELLSTVSQPLLQLVIDHTKELVMNNAALLFVLAVLTHAQGDTTSAMKAIADIAAEPFSAGSLENYHIVEHPAGHMAMKRLVANDAQRMKEGRSDLFSEVLISTLPEGALKSWAACNRGCFTLISLLELNIPGVSGRIQSELGTITESLGKMEFKGAQILLQKLKNMT